MTEKYIKELNKMAETAFGCVKCHEEKCSCCTSGIICDSCGWGICEECASEEYKADEKYNCPECGKEVENFL